MKEAVRERTASFTAVRPSTAPLRGSAQDDMRSAQDDMRPAQDENGY